MDQKVAIEKIAEIEKRFDVNSVRYKGLKVWPLIRLALWQQLSHPDKDFVGQLSFPQRTKTHSSKSLLRNAKAIFKLTSFILNLILTYLNNWRLHQRPLKKLRQNSPVDVLFFSRIVEHSNQINGRYYNQYIDSMIDLVRERQSFLKIEIGSSKLRTTLPRFESTIFINAGLFFIIKNIIKNIPGKLRDSIQINSIVNFTELQKIVFKITGGININETYFVNQFKAVEKYKDFFKKVLSIIHPKVVFLVCYYNPTTMALIVACRELSIKSVDIQHGRQGEYHSMYSYWTKFPEEGYELLPDFFWVWGQESKEYIKRCQPASLKRNIPVIGGNPWLSQWIHSNRYENVSEEYENFYNSLKQYEKIALFTSQLYPEPFPEHILNAMRNSPDSWIWLIRIHPQQRDQLAEIDNFLQKSGIKKFEIDFSSRIFLYSLLKRVHHHLTCWSSVCYESLYFHVPTTIVHTLGRQVYHEYIDKGIFNYSISDKKILEIIENSTSTDMMQEEIPYIETDPKNADDALQKILNSSI